jgi:hypothetical protein
MSYNRHELASHIAKLKDNANFQHYVEMLETHYNDRLTALIVSPHPDEALRGECRALHNILKNINRPTGDLT